MEYKPEKVRLASEKIEAELTEDRRQYLALKGQRLYFKFCGLNGEGICAESFAEYHLLRGEDVIVHDLLEFLHQEADILRPQTDSASRERLRMTELLIKRVQALAGEPQEAE